MLEQFNIGRTWIIMLVAKACHQKRPFYYIILDHLNLLFDTKCSTSCSCCKCASIPTHKISNKFHLKMKYNYIDFIVSHLCAIPWVFAWTQTRLILPSWLDIGASLKIACDNGHTNDLIAIYKEWPFFQSTMDLIEMVLGKADVSIAKRYDEILVTSESRRKLEADLINELMASRKFGMLVTGHEKPLESNRMLRKLVDSRLPYLNPIYCRLRSSGCSGRTTITISLEMICSSPSMESHCSCSWSSLKHKSNDSHGQNLWCHLKDQCTKDNRKKILQ